MTNHLKAIPDFDEIVFEVRNKEYGAYQLRKKYNRNVLIALLLAVMIMSTAVITPFLNAKADGSGQRIIERPGPIVLDVFEIPTEPVAPPPPPPPAPKEAVQMAYLPPEIVDFIKPGDESGFLTTDQITDIIKDIEVVEKVDDVKIEIQAGPEPEIFYRVEEMPMYPGGNSELLKYIAEHVIYPEVARENNIQGRVIVKFCVTSSGGIDQISILKGIDPELDAEVLRVLKTLPAFKPGLQGGKPVPVWYTAPINFKLK